MGFHHTARLFCPDRFVCLIILSAFLSKGSTRIKAGFLTQSKNYFILKVTALGSHSLHFRGGGAVVLLDEEHRVREVMSSRWFSRGIHTYPRLEGSMPGIVSEDTHLCTKPQPCQGTSTVTRPCPAAAAGAGADVRPRKAGRRGTISQKARRLDR